ncbi:MAG: sensor histidine kinase [Specibacter sp.]
MPAVSTPEIPQPTSNPSRSVKTTWTYTLGSIVFILVVLDTLLVGLALQAFTDRNDAVSRLLLVSLVIAVATQVRYCWFLRAGLGGGVPGTAWTLALLIPSVTVWVLGLFSPANALMSVLPLWLAVCLLACLLPTWKQRLAVLGAGLAAALVHPAAQSVLRGQHEVAAADASLRMLFFYAAGMPVILMSSLWWWRVVVELDRHRLLAGELAVAQERLRFAADLHDIQGHHLQVIALKSELAERLIITDAEAARGHIHETRLIAKQALEETRSLVSGYRETVLENELENAREVLSAAGAHCELSLDPLPGSQAVHKALAMTVREATTNILRHSEATRASITLATSSDACTLTICNNGATSHPTAATTAGTGLSGLRARVEAVGGTLETTLTADRFELQALVPTKVAQP